MNAGVHTIADNGSKFSPASGSQLTIDHAAVIASIMAEICHRCTSAKVYPLTKNGVTHIGKMAHIRPRKNQ